MTKSSPSDVLIALVAVLLAPVFVFWLSPMILCDLWRWFVVPLGVQAIGHWQAFGLYALSGCMRNSPVNYLVNRIAENTVGSVEISKSVLAVYVAELVFWGLGYLAS